MSSFCQLTKHPETKKWHYAMWLDDYYGIHRYGVKFSSGEVFNPLEIKMQTKNRFGGIKRMVKLKGVQK